LFLLPVNLSEAEDLLIQRALQEADGKHRRRRAQARGAIARASTGSWLRRNRVRRLKVFGCFSRDN